MLNSKYVKIWLFKQIYQLLSLSKLHGNFAVVTTMDYRRENQPSQISNTFYGNQLLLEWLILPVPTKVATGFGTTTFQASYGIKETHFKTSNSRWYKNMKYIKIPTIKPLS